jgi:hypothetical protein
LPWENLIRKEGFMRKVLLSSVVCLMVILGFSLGQAQAALWSQTITASGTAGGLPVAASATFTLNSLTDLTITLENDTAAIAAIVQELGGVSFSLSGSPGMSLTSVTPAGLVTYDPQGSATGSSPYGWGLTSSGLFAGSGSWHPYAIVNDNVTVADGIPNAQHNPLLVGPVDFDITLSGLSSTPTLDFGAFYFGTSGDTIVPLPGALLLLAPGLMGLAAFRKRIFG